LARALLFQNALLQTGERLFTHKKWFPNFEKRFIIKKYTSQNWEKALYTQKMVSQLGKTFYEQKIRFPKMDKGLLIISVCPFFR
jgi:hypothetical protein